MNREIKTDLKNILSLISVAEDYGFEDVVLFSAFSDMLGGRLDLNEIEWYAKSVEAIDGFTNEDYRETKIRLTNFRIKYCKTT